MRVLLGIKRILFIEWILNTAFSIYKVQCNEMNIRMLIYDYVFWHNCHNNIRIQSNTEFVCPW